MKKIMFNEPFGLQQATFDKIKDMTRRLVPKRILAKVDDYRREYYKHTLDRISVEDAIMNMVGPDTMFKAPYEVGEVVAIAQRYSDIFDDAYHIGLLGRTAGWKNKMYVSAEYMPHKICMTDMRVEYLQDISDEDCLREGVLHSDKYAMPFGIPLNHGGVFFYYDTPREAFASLIDKVSGKGTWERNPLVFVYPYELVN